MAPEAFDEDSLHRRGIDTWAFGIILNELINEEKPY